MWCLNKRAQVLANCKCLYGPDIDVVTLSYGGGLHQAVAMKFDPFTASWTRFLHSTEGESCSNGAISSLLEKTETEIAKLFSTNDLSVPFSGDPVQTMTLQRVRSHSAANSSGCSSLEFIATPDSENCTTFEEAIHVDSATVEADMAIEESVPEPEPEPVEEETSGWGSFSTSKKKKKGRAIVEEVAEVEELIPEPELEPAPEPVEEETSGWGYFSTSKRKKKGKAVVEDVVVIEEPVPEPEAEPVVEEVVEFEEFLPEPEPELAVEEVVAIEEPVPVPESESAVEESSGWGGFSSSKKKKKAKSVFGFIEEFTKVEEALVAEPEPEPEQAPVEDEFWGFSASSKKGKKKQSRFIFEEPIVEDTPLPDPEPEPETEPEPAPIEDDSWGLSGSSKKGKKKKSWAVVEEPIIEDIPLPDPESEPAPVEDDGWGSFKKKKDKKKKSRVIIEEPIFEDMSPSNSNPIPEPAEDDGLDFGTSRINEKKEGQSNVEDVLRMEVTADELPIETFKAPPVIETVNPSTTTISLAQTVLTNPTSQPPVVKTIVLKIVHTSTIGTQTLQTMVNLADNTKKAIFDAVNQYLDHSSYVQYCSGYRLIEIKLGSGKNGDLDLSALEESRWPEYLEYLSQYTRFPELVVHASDLEA